MTEGEYKKNIADFITEIAPNFKRSSIVCEVELQNQDYSLSDVKSLYENGIEALDASLDRGGSFAALEVCAAAYAVLIRLGINKKEYIEWAERQDYVNTYILKRVVGIIDKACEAAFVTLCVQDEKNRLYADKARAMLIPTDEATVLSLYGHNVAVTERMRTHLDVKRQMCNISENAVKQFEKEYNTSISNYASLQKNLMMVIQDAAESALEGIRKYLEKKECESQFGQVEKRYLDMVARNSPYTIVLEGLEQICNQYQSQTVKNEVDRLRRESRHFVGGGFGIRGLVAGTVMAKAANSAAGAFNGAVNGINNWLNDTRMRSKLDKLANAPKQRQLYKESIQKNILALEGVLCDVLCPTDNVEERMDEAFQEFHQEVTLPPMLLKASPSELQEVLYLSLLKRPYTGYLKAAFDVLGDKDNELEVLAIYTEQTDFLKYKYKKQQKKEEEIPRFSLTEEILSNEWVLNFLNEAAEIKKAIQGDWTYEIAGEMIGKLQTAHVQAHTNVPPEYGQIFNGRLQAQERTMLQVLQKTACVAGNRSYVNYFEACLMMGYAEEFEDIYTKYTLDFVKDFSDRDFEKRRQYLLQTKNKSFLLKDHYSLFSKKLQDHVNEMLEKIDFVKYMSKNPAIRSGKAEHDFSVLFQKRFKSLLETAKTLPLSGHYEWGKYVQGGIWRKDVLKEMVLEYDYRYKNEDVRKTIGEPCGQYVLLHHKYGNLESGEQKGLVLTDQFLYLGEKRFPLQQLTAISNYVSMDGKERKIFLHKLKERIPCDEDLFESDSLIPQFYNTVRHFMPDFDNEPKDPIFFVKCLKCGSHEVKFGKLGLGMKCKACGASESFLSTKSKIGFFDSYGPFRDKAESAFKHAEENPGNNSCDKWYCELME